MTVIDLHTDPKKVAIILLLQKIKVFNPLIGAYIEHFYYTEQEIIIKLTNGILKIKEYLLHAATKQKNDILLCELEKAANSFVKMHF